MGRSIFRALLLLCLAVLLTPTCSSRPEPPALPAPPAVVPVSAEPVVILQISDIHIDDKPETLALFAGVVDMANSAIHPDITLLTGDLTDQGYEPQMKLFRPVMDKIKGPVYAIPGNHEWQTENAEFYRKYVGTMSHSVDVGRYHLVGLDSTKFDETALAWAKGELLAAKAKGQTNIIFLHHPPRLLKVSLNDAIKKGDVKLVLCGHIHRNTIINQNGVVQVTTTSIKRPIGGDPRGYAIHTLEDGQVNVHFVPLERKDIVAIARPIAALTATGPAAVVRGKSEIHVMFFGGAASPKLTASIDGGAEIRLKRKDGDLFAAPWDSTTVGDGLHQLTVWMTGAAGEAASETISFVVNQRGDYAPAKGTYDDLNNPRISVSVGP